MQLLVLDEGEHHLVVFKPANMVVMSGRGVPRPTLLDLASIQFGKGIRPVHRLDRGTAGCCLLAKDLFGQQALSNAFRRHLVEKHYLAIVEGEVGFDKLNIDVRLQRENLPLARKGPLAKQHINDDGKRALTRVAMWAKQPGLSVVHARPVTGRMHQIRAHLAHIGHPIIGDKQYGSPASFFLEKQIGLLAFAIGFPEPKGQRRFVVTPMPSNFVQYLAERNIDVREKIVAIQR